jgi:hypothetical protein
MCVCVCGRGGYLAWSIGRESLPLAPVLVGHASLTRAVDFRGRVGAHTVHHRPGECVASNRPESPVAICVVSVPHRNSRATFNDTVRCVVWRRADHVIIFHHGALCAIKNPPPSAVPSHRAVVDPPVTRRVADNRCFVRASPLVRTVIRSSKPARTKLGHV